MEEDTKSVDGVPAEESTPPTKAPPEEPSAAELGTAEAEEAADTQAQVGQPAPPVPQTMEERVKLLEDKVEFLLGAHQTLFLLVKALGDMVGVPLKHRQVPGGMQFYWERAADKRIVLPGRSN